MSYSLLNSLTELIDTTCIYSTDIYDEHGKRQTSIEIDCKVHDFEYKVEDTLYCELGVTVKLIPLDIDSVDEDTLHELYNGVPTDAVSFNGYGSK